MTKPAEWEKIISCIIYIATSLDGYITDRYGGLDWLQSIPNPEKLDLGWTDFLNRIDAIIMGRNTFEKVCSFDVAWPYPKPVFVLSHALKTVPEKYQDKVKLIKGSPQEVLKQVRRAGYQALYIDGGATIQNFLEEDLIDELIITTLPILLGGGIPLFSQLPKELTFDHIKTEVLLNAMVQSHYQRKK